VIDVSVNLPPGVNLPQVKNYCTREFHAENRAAVLFI